MFALTAPVLKHGSEECHCFAAAKGSGKDIFNRVALCLQCRQPFESTVRQIKEEVR